MRRTLNFLLILVFCSYNYLIRGFLLKGIKGQQRRHWQLQDINFPSPAIEDIQLFNTLSRKKEKFKSINEGKVSFYSCGPTVYDYAHIGNFRAFLTYDLVKRWLMYCQYDVDHVCNLTDIDDKIIIKMIAEGKSLQEITTKYSKAFFDDLHVLNIIKARIYPKATEYIHDIESMIQRLCDAGYAYIKNGSVYFRVNAFHDYGKFANLNFNEMEDGAGGYGPNDRRGIDEKENTRDFALWKAFTEQDGDVAWDSIFGKGRPGWHIECSAMCNKLLGPTIDIHAGGVDLIFPHHQNEIAQSEAYSGKQFSRYWIHNGFVNIDNEKMSKSLKNFKTLRDIVTEPNDARAFRYMVITNQYRNPLNFNNETLKAARNSLKRIDKLILRLKDTTGMSNSYSPIILLSELKAMRSQHENQLNDKEVQEIITNSIQLFHKAMSDDLNTPQAIAAMFKIIKFGEKVYKMNTMTSSIAIAILTAIQMMDSVFGVLYDVPIEYFNNDNDNNESNNNKIKETEERLKSLLSESPSDGCMDPNCITHGDETFLKVKELAERRAVFKAEKKYQEADVLREEITALGYGVKDHKDGFDLFVL